MSRSGYWSIGYASAEGKITQVLCLTSSLAEYLSYGKQQGLFKYPKGQACLDDLSDVSKMRVKVELQRRPGEDGDSLTCEICKVNPNDTRLEPCGHFICNHCCRRIQGGGSSKSSALCYRCNSKILCTTPIEIRVKTIETDNPHPSAGIGDQSQFKNFSGANKSNPGSKSAQDFTPLRPENNFAGRGPKNQDILQAAERVAATCGRDQVAVETDMRVLCGDGYGLEQVVDALISTGGDRAKAREYLQNSYRNAQDDASSRSTRSSRSKNSFTGRGPKNQDILRAVERVAATCGRDQEAVETDLRILYGDGYGLEQVVDALISTGGDRAKAREMLRKP